MRSEAPRVEAVTTEFEIPSEQMGNGWHGLECANLHQPAGDVGELLLPALDPVGLTQAFGGGNVEPHGGQRRGVNSSAPACRSTGTGMGAEEDVFLRLPVVTGMKHSPTQN